MMPKEFLFSLSKKDFELQFFRAGGKGGQKQNKTSSGCRIIHKASGARGESREERKQSDNKRNAFKRLTETVKFRTWLRMRMHEINTGETVEQKVERSMQAKNLLVESVDLTTGKVEKIAL